MSAIGADYIRSPISGSTVMASQGSLTAILSGPAHAVERLDDSHQAFARKTFVVGEVEDARYLKLALDTLVGVTFAPLAEALAIGRKGGLGGAATMDVICQSAVASPLLQYKRDKVVNGTYAPAFTVQQVVKDFDLSRKCRGRTIAPFRWSPRSVSSARRRSPTDAAISTSSCSSVRRRGLPGFNRDETDRIDTWRP
jgi:3-hydroxyisobutyrate dehydrogenase-like beta-hydroxyacid dehydrogenase